MRYQLPLMVLSILLSQVSGNVLDTVTDIRLTGGSGPYEGRVELAVSGIWGTICDTNFDIEDAQVLCGMLNLQATAFIRGAYHGEGTGPVYADNLQCRGTENDVGDCRYDSGSTCSHSNDVSLICTECGLIRWGNGNLSVSSDGTTLQILCDDQTNNKISVCQPNGTWTNRDMYCPHPDYPLPFNDTRLEYGAGLYDGRVELMLNGIWGTICGTNFRETEAIAICNMLNLTYHNYIPGDHAYAYFYNYGSGPMYIDNLYCTGTETNINQCKYDIVNECERYDYPVAVICEDPRINITDIRLVDGTGPYDGRVQVYWDGVWGSICHYRNRKSDDDVRFLCSMLNLNFVHLYDTAYFGYDNDEPVLLDFDECLNNANAINRNTCTISPPYRSKCQRSYTMSLACSKCPEPNILNGTVKESIGTSIIVNCDPGFAPKELTMICNETEWIQNEWCTKYDQPVITDVRMTGTTGPYYGVPEVEINGTWLPVCHEEVTDYGYAFAYVICNEVGAATRWSNMGTYYGFSADEYVIRLNCPNNDAAINDCQFITDNSCSGAVNLKCYGPDLNITEVRLVNGTSERDGRAEIKVGDTWGAICDNGFDIQDANAFCRMLDLKAVQYFPGSKYGVGTGPVFVDEFRCTSTNTLPDCLYYYYNDCDNSSIASVMCNECGEIELSHWDVSFLTYRNNEVSADCSYYGTYVGSLDYTCNNVTQTWETVGKCLEYTYPLNVSDVRLVNGTSGRVELKTLGYWGTICGDMFDQNAADMICAMVGYWPAVAYYTNALHGEGSGPIFVDDLRCEPNVTDLNDCTYITDDDCTHSKDVSVVCTDCGDPVPVDGYANTSRTNVSTVVEITCHNGYILVGTPIMTCHLNGSWSSQPSCRLIDCGDPTPEHGVVNTTETTNGTTVLVSCDTGYELSGAGVIVCQENDTWSDYPSCLMHDCGNPTPSNADVDLPSGVTTYGATATITCHTGYLPTGSSSVSCLANGTWEMWPTCEIIDCNDPTPFRGLVNSSETTYGSIVKVSCEQGLNISGSSVIECLLDGTWSDTPTCDLSDCGIPQIANGIINADKTVLGSSANVSCNPGYDLNGPDLIQCTSIGWNDSSLTCIIQECVDPTPLNGTLVVYSGFNYGDTATVECFEGFELQGDAIITCDDGGVWSSITVCVLKDCGPPNQLVNGLIEYNSGTKYQDKATFSCNVGYLLVGTDEMTCNSDGAWSSDPPMCQRLASVGMSCTNDTFCRTIDAKCVQNTCQCQTGIYDQRTDTCDAMPLFEFGASKDTILRPNFRCSRNIEYRPGIPMHGNLYKKLQICRNGYVKFEKLPNELKFSVLAPYWSSQIDIRHGTLFYRAYHILSDDTMMKYKEEMEFIKTIVATYSGLTTFEASFILVATWENLKTSNRNYDTSKTITFQLVLATDGAYTFTFYIYGNGKMNWVKRNVVSKLKLKSTKVTLIGSFFESNKYSHPYSFEDAALRMDEARQKGVSGIVFIPLFKQPIGSLPPDPSSECIKWYNENRDEEEHMNWISRLLPDCPCDIWLAQWDPWFWKIGLQRSRKDVSHVCVDMIPGRTFDTYGKSCCYDLTTWLWVDERSVAGNLYRYNQDHPVEHFQHDTRPKEICCSTPYCHLFYKLRPQGVCYNTSPYNFGTFWGDPHFQTLDGLNFTFNGLGEYTLLLLESNNITFELQARLAQATNKNGSLIDATFFSAFAVLEKQNNDNSSFHVELSKSKKGLNWFSNKIDKSVGYAVATKEDKDFVYSSEDGRQVISRRGSAMSVFFLTSGISFNVTVNVGMLTLTLNLHKKYHGQTTGLLGNYNENPDDDFILPNGTKMSTSMSEKQIFEYGQHWAINSSNSHFVYEKGKSHEDYHNSSFVPKFLADVDNATKDAAAVKCNGSQNNECVMDFVATGREDVANATLIVKNIADVTHRQMDESLPMLEGCGSVNITVNQAVVCPVVIDDDTIVTFIANNANAVFDSQERAVTFYQDADNPFDIRIVALNANNRSSTMYIMNGLICSGCNSHGTCANYNRADSRETEHFKYAACICEPEYTGDDCESVFDGCEEIPCSLDRSCTSLSAEEQIEQNRTYVCDPCPEGYIGSGDSNEICTDIYECEQSPCAHECINTDGSYQCICNDGYRILSTDPHTCRDINECEEYLDKCTQVCYNYDGGYNCSCFTGHVYNMSTNICEQDQPTADVCSQSDLNCSLAAGCTVDEIGNANCFCDQGYELNGTNVCVDIDECMHNVCPQNCENTDGRFVCSCMPGYQLVGLLECEECDSSHWGNNCEQDCICTGQGAVSCDPIRGCICSDGWKGNTCDDNVDECSDVNICNDPMKYCVDYPGSYNCLCRNGYVETADGHCEDFDECLNPVDNDCEQICVNTFGNYSCQCKSGFNIKNRNFCEDIDECSIGKHSCEQICTNYPGSYNCFCDFGYSLNDDRETCTKLKDPCYDINDMTCQHFCHHITEDEFECRCQDGYVLSSDGQSCNDVNECTEGTSLCTDGATCHNTNGSYECECPIGSKLDNDGRTCLECDEQQYGDHCEYTCSCLNGACDTVNGGCFCDAGWDGDNCSVDFNECGQEDICTDLNTVCINTPGEYECRCDTGYYNDSGVCMDINECDDVFTNNCDQLCINTAGSYTCQCTSGFMTNGNKCEDINECNGHHNCDHLCENTMGSYKCYCEDGYKLNPKSRQQCIPISECDQIQKDYCGSNASCFIKSEEAHCKCIKGFDNSSGYCQDIDECELHMCDQNCDNTEGSFICSCGDGYTLAEDDISCKVCSNWTFGEECASNCSCERSTTESCDHITGQCKCMEGWQGTVCGTDIDECENVTTCPNEYSNCTNTVGGYECGCRTGYFLTDNDVCQECQEWMYGVDCMLHCSCNQSNTASCDHVTGFCTCAEGWTDIDCDIKCSDWSYWIDCLSNCSCNQSNTVSCDHVTGFCTCAEGWYGTYCDIKCSDWSYGIDCLSNCYCNQSNTASCDHVTGFCTCAEGWNGTNCDNDVDECVDDTTCPNPHSYCNNTMGGFECNCENGYFKFKDNTCNVCSNWTFGEECSSNCTCERSTTESCDHITGQCMCMEGWQGTVCGVDVDECEDNTTCPNEHSNCTNTMGGYECGCTTGYFLTDNDVCQECQEWMYGVDCMLHCSCNQSNTASCDHVTGFCTCAEGWTDTDCDIKCSDWSYGIDCMSNCSCNQSNTVSCDHVTGFCTCAEGWTDTDCDIKCSDWSYGIDCMSNCSCNQSNTASCDHVTGFCTCAESWNGTSCDNDVNECEDNTTCPNPHSYCNNTMGGFECNCENGYFKFKDNTCNECPEWTYGVDCAENCSCIQNNTEHCETSNGTCTCYKDWTGTDCSDDVNECEINSTCPYDHFHCVNTIGGFNCACDLGFAQTDINTCEACSDWTFGQECSLNCSCERPTTESCDHITGQCMCKEGWQGIDCGTDIDECNDDTTCPKPHSLCRNTIGGFECNCENGYYKSSDASCRVMKLVVTHVVKIAFTLPQEADLTNETYSKTLDHELVDALKAFFSKRVSVVLDFHINDKRVGSLIVNYSVAYEVRDIQVMSDIVSVIQELNEGSVLEIEGKAYSVISDFVSSNDPCEVYRNVVGDCEQGYTCIVLNGAGICRKDNDEYNLDIIIVVSAATGSVVLLGIIICLGVWLRKRSNKRKKKQHTTQTNKSHDFNKFGTSVSGESGHLTWRSMLTGKSTSSAAHMQYRIPRARGPVTAHDNEFYIQ